MLVVAPVGTYPARSLLDEPPRRARRGEPRALVDEIVASAASFPLDECALWPFARWGSGYGLITVDGRSRVVSRIVCAEVHGPPPPRHEAAHVCGNRLCVNPRHLRWASPVENQADAKVHGTFSPPPAASVQRAKTHCPRGHEYTPENTLGGGRQGRKCRTCHRERARQRRKS